MISDKFVEIHAVLSQPSIQSFEKSHKNFPLQRLGKTIILLKKYRIVPLPNNFRVEIDGWEFEGGEGQLKIGTPEFIMDAIRREEAKVLV